MNPFANMVSGILRSVTESAGAAAASSVAKNPTVQGALTEAQAQLDQAKTAAYIAAGVALVVVTFYYVPRFESPIPRIFRGRR